MIYREENKIKINGLIFTIFLLWDFVIDILNIYFGIQGIALPLLLIAILISVYTNKYKINIVWIYIIFFVMAIFFCDFMINGLHKTSVEYFLYFISFGIAFSYMGSTKFELRPILDYGRVIGYLSLPICIGKYFKIIDSGTLMWVSYNILILLCIYYIAITERKKINIKQNIILDIISFGIYCWFLLTIGSRGALLALGMFIVLMIFKNNTFSLMAKVVSVLVSGIIITWVIFNMEKIFYSIYILASKMGVELEFLAKTARLVSAGDLSNGRIDLYKLGNEMIKKSPLIGNGIGAFEEKYDIYVHNIFYQISLEMGLIIFSIVFVVIALGIYCCISNGMDEEKRTIMLVLCVVTIPRLSVSYIFWKSNTFWMLITYILCVFIENKIKIHQYNRRIS